MIPEGFITGLLDRADIVDVINRYVPLKKAGRNWMACCPFHKEKTPSFSVSQTKQFFKCFGCGEAGNAIGFIMKYEGLEFPDAVKKLASLYAMDVPEDQSPAKREARQKARTLTDYMGEAANFYTEQLRNTPFAAEYLKNRQITGATAQTFGLGYSPDDWHSLQRVFGERYNDKALEDCGLINTKNGRRYDAFRGRIMFPIRNAKGLVIGFGARTMKGDEQPKYLNSPETPIYHKGSELYGYFEGRDAIYAKGRAIVCEGYMDVIQLSQAGFREAVAALGTSITPEHVRKLFKLTDAVFFSFDGDAAGRKAARRALEATLPVISDVQKAGFILLPPEHDPDSLIKAEGSEGFERQIDKAYGLTDFMKHLLLEGKELMYAEERAKVVAEAKPWVLSMQHAPILRSVLIRELAGIARLQVEDIEKQFGLVPARSPVSTFGGDKPWRRGNDRYGRNARWQRPAPEPRLRVKDIRERILQCFLSYPSLVTEYSHAIEEEFLTSPHPAAERIVEVWRAAAAEEDGGHLNPASLLMRLAESEHIAYYETLLTEELTTGTPEEGARMEVRKAFIELELERTKARIEQMAHDAARDMDAMRKLNDRRAELQKLADEAKIDERGYRLRQETQARFDAQQAASMRDEPDNVTLSNNPIVAKLQLFLRGKSESTDGATVATAPQDRMAHVREALSAREGARAAAMATSVAVEAPEPQTPVPMPEAIGASEEVWEGTADLSSDAMPPSMEEYDYSGLPDEVPPDDEAPYVYEDMSDSDADLNTGL